MFYLMQQIQNIIISVWVNIKNYWDILYFVLGFQITYVSLMCILHLCHISFWTSHIASALGEHCSMYSPALVFWTIWRQGNQCGVEIMFKCPYPVHTIHYYYHLFGVSPLKMLAITEQRPSTTWWALFDIVSWTSNWLCVKYDSFFRILCISARIPEYFRQTATCLSSDNFQIT